MGYKYNVKYISIAIKLIYLRYCYASECIIYNTIENLLLDTLSLSIAFKVMLCLLVIKFSAIAVHLIIFTIYHKIGLPMI